MSNAKASEKTEWISLASVVSCIAVVFLHTNGCFWTFSKERYWFTANIIESVCYFAVPCFFMITGATLMDYSDRYSLRTYFEKRVRKTLIPYIAWSTIGIAYAISIGNLSISDITPGYVWDAYINSKAVSIYWFFPVLFGLYLTIPILSAVEKRARKKVFMLTAAAMFVFGSMIPFALKIAEKTETWNGAVNVQIGQYAFYLIVGYLIAEYSLNNKQRIAVYLLGIIGLMLHICGTYYLSINAGEIIQTYKGYTNVPCIMYSIAIFVWCKYKSDKILCKGFFKRMIEIINSHTLSIYLLQFFIYSTMIRILDINTHAIIYRLFAPFVIIPIAIALSYSIRKTPGLRTILP